jgi:thiol-disulfide isomerase/thioredoxin
MHNMLRFSVVHWVPKLLISMFWLHGVLQLKDVHGVAHTPLVLHDQKAAVLIFVGVECPISNSYAPEINRVVKAYSDKGLDFYIVYSDPDLTVDATAKHVKAYGYTCPALMDTEQRLMKKVNATVTPEAAVVDGHGKLLYEGRIDNWYEDFGKQRYEATTHDLRDALDAIIAGKKVATPVTKAVGCPI